MDFAWTAGLLRLSRLRERPTRPRAMRSIVPRAAGEGSLLLGILSASLDGPIAETALSPV